MLAKLAEARKAVATLVGVALTVLTLVNDIPFLPASISVPIGAIIGVLTVIATYAIPNKKASVAPAAA